MNWRTVAASGKVAPWGCCLVGECGLTEGDVGAQVGIEEPESAAAVGGAVVVAADHAELGCDEDGEAEASEAVVGDLDVVELVVDDWEVYESSAAWRVWRWGRRLGFGLLAVGLGAWAAVVPV